MAKANSELRVFAPALTLLVMAVLINYVDRGNLSLAAPILKSPRPSPATGICTMAPF